MNPYGTFIFLIAGIIISLFFGISKKEAVKIFIFVIVCFLLTSAFFINIYGFLLNENFSSNLFTSGIVEVIEIAVILFFAIICISVIFIYHRNNNHFIKIIIIFLFLIICVLTLIISKNFIAFFISLSCFLISFFAITTVLNDSRFQILINNDNIRESKILFLKFDTLRSIIRFCIATLFFIVLLFYGFSILYGVTDVKNFLQLFQNIEPAGINIILSLIIISIAFYIYLGLFPFQAPYINFSNKAEPSSLYLLWLFYFPAGIFALLKFLPIILILNKNLKAGSYILYVLLLTVFLSSIGSGIGGLKTKSLRKISSYIFTLIITGYFINMIILISGFIKEQDFNGLNIFYLLLIVLSFLPVIFILSFIENSLKKDSIENIKSLIYKNKYIGIVFLISVFSLAGIPGFFGYIGQKYYIDLIVNIINIKTKLNGLNRIQGWLILLVLIIYTAAFIAVYLRLIIIIFIKRNKEDNDSVDNYNFSKKFYILVGIFALLIIFSGIMGLLETLNPQINLFGFRITNSAIFIKNLK
jgi:NADH:ubiquinone oxidoreductase subunit 2 (subunit N)